MCHCHWALYFDPMLILLIIFEGQMPLWITVFYFSRLRPGSWSLSRTSPGAWARRQSSGRATSCSRPGTWSRSWPSCSSWCRTPPASRQQSTSPRSSTPTSAHTPSPSSSRLDIYCLLSTSVDIYCLLSTSVDIYSPLDIYGAGVTQWQWKELLFIILENIRHVSFDEWKLQKVLNGKDISGSSLRLIGSSSVGTFKYKPTGRELRRIF